MQKWFVLFFILFSSLPLMAHVKAKCPVALIEMMLPDARGVADAAEAEFDSIAQTIVAAINRRYIEESAGQKILSEIFKNKKVLLKGIDDIQLKHNISTPSQNAGGMHQVLEDKDIKPLSARLSRRTSEVNLKAKLLQLYFDYEYFEAQLKHLMIPKENADSLDTEAQLDKEQGLDRKKRLN